ncbi:MAG: DUF1549 domain-containing protein [Gemmataceae bacterium]
MVRSSDRKWSCMRCTVWGATVCLLLIGASAQGAEPPLHERIDQLIAAQFSRHGVQPAPLASEAEFLRRVYLDLTGAIPTTETTRRFLENPAPHKRQQLIDELLASPEFARRMQMVVDVLLMERRPDKHVPRAAWQDYLRTSFAENKPWDQLVREILSNDGAEPKNRTPAKFFLDRDAEPHQITQDVGRLFLARNMQCAQCHDHPVVHDYLQEHYYGIFAFLDRSSLFTDPAKKLVMLAEKADGETTFQSVFDPQKITKKTEPRLPGGKSLPDPSLPKGKEYQVKPAKDVRPVPTYSRRALLAEQVVTSEAFRRNSANRFFAMMMGRGIVHPVDLDSKLNPPSHPELLDLLAAELAASQYDVKAFLRELALSQTYQRSSEQPSADKPVAAASFAVAQLKPLSPEQLALSILQATGFTDAERLALGANATEAALYARQAASVNAIVNVFAGQPGQAEDQSFEATLDQTLFVTNGAVIRNLLAPRNGNLISRLAPLTDADAIADELFLSILTRPPTPTERQEVASFLKDNADNRQAALQEITWALLASAEFRFNH